MRLVMGVILLASISSFSYASDDEWVFIGSGSTNKVYMQNVEVSTNIDNGIVEAWSKWVYKDGNHILEKVKYSCSNDEYLTLEDHNYDADGVYQSGGKLKPIWFSVIPESLGVLLIETACYAGAKQEIDKLVLLDSGYVEKDTFELITNSFGRYADAVLMMSIQESIDNIEW